MIRNAVVLTLALILMSVSGVAFACEYKKGESKYAEYATCVYGEEAIVAVDLPQDNQWDQCVYLAQAFRPPKLLAVTKDENGKEVASINDRAQIGNPCYLTKQQCDKAFKASQN